MEGNTCGVAVVGGGPAGCAAAIQLARYGLHPVIFEKNRVGGLLCNANLVENYPGFADGISGLELATLFDEHLRRLKVEVKKLEVLGFERKEAGPNRSEDFTIMTGKESFRARAIVAATGTRAKRLEISLPEAARSRVAYEIGGILDQQNKEIAIVGSGDAAFDYALNLAKRCNEVVILNRRARVKCLPLLVERAMAEDRICYEEDAELEQVGFSDQRLLLHYRQGAESRTLPVDLLVVAVGRVPELSCIPEWARADYASLENGGRFHFAGDVMRGQYRQTAIAVGDGLHAAMRIYESLKEDQCR